MLKKINKLLTLVADNGFSYVVKKMFSRVFAALGVVEDIPAVRRRLSSTFFDLTQGTVIAGPLKSLKLSKPHLQWSRYDVPSIVLGLYEMEVVDRLVNLSATRSHFVDIGAADGVFGVGLIHAGFYQRATCFEIDEVGRRNIRALATLNTVETLVQIESRADPISISRVLGSSSADAVILCDIEGSEFVLLNDEFLNSCGEAVLVIEIHDQYSNRPTVDALKQRLSERYQVDVITTGARDLSNLPHLKFLHDNERWLICSEGRGWLMEWWVCSRS